MFRLVHVGLALAALGFACAGNDDGAVVDSVAGNLGDAFATTGGTMSDREIVGALTAANAAEIELSQLALDSAQNADVKSFAQMMVTDHRALNEQVHSTSTQLDLMSTAGERAENLAESAGDDADDLRDAGSAEFDRAYMEHMVSSHEQTLQVIDRAAQATNTRQLDQLLTDARTKVQQHLERARQLQRTLQQ